MDKTWQVFLIDSADQSAVKTALSVIGIDDDDIGQLDTKARFRHILVRDVPTDQAHLLKEAMLGSGGDAAMSRDAYVFSAAQTDVLLIGTLKQYAASLAGIALLPFNLSDLAAKIKSALFSYEGEPGILHLGRYKFDLRQRTLIAGIVNITPDSFSDGGRFFDSDMALSHAIELAEQGADIIDIGGESTRPGSEPVSSGEEIDRVIPVIEKACSVLDVPVSVDTYKAEVAEAALKAGAVMVNDVSGLKGDPDMIKTIAKTDAALVVMHMLGQPKTMQDDPQYDEVVDDVTEFLRGQVEKAVDAGILKSRILCDPGIGFGKTVDHNIKLIRRLRQLKVIGCPIYIGPSRKSFIGKLTGASVDDRLSGTIAAVTAAIINGASVIRVHDVAQISEAVKIADAIVREQKHEDID